MVADGGMPPVRVVEPLEVWSKTAERAWFRLVKPLRSKSSVSREAKKDSATALSWCVASPSHRHCDAGCLAKCPERSGCVLTLAADVGMMHAASFGSCGVWTPGPECLLQGV